LELKDLQSNHKSKTQGNKFLIGFKMSIQIVLRDKSFINKKGKKITIIDGEEVKQFWFPEEVWEIIKEFLITPRSMMLLKMQKLGHARLCKIFWIYFSSDYKQWEHAQIMNANYATLEERKRFIKSRIIKGCESPTKHAEIMEKEFQVKPKDYEWLKDFAVGEEVLVRKFKSKKKWTVTYNRKGVVRKIGKIIQVELYEYDCIDNRTRLRWLETFDEKVSVYHKKNITKKGKHMDEYFVEGRVYY
jgi:hypothetical protein